MKKFLHLLFTVVLVPFFSKAQKQPGAVYYQNLISKNFSFLGIHENELRNWRISDAYFDVHANATYIYLQQVYKGIDIENAINAVCFKNEEPVTHNLSVIRDFKVSGEKITPAISAQNALTKAAGILNIPVSSSIVSLRSDAESHSQEFSRSGISQNNIPVKLLWVNTGKNHIELRLAWEVFIKTKQNNALWQVMVDAQTGAEIRKTNLTVYENSSQDIKRRHNIFIYEEDEPQQDLSGNSTQDIKNITSSKYRVIPYPYESPLYTNGAVVTDPWAKNHNQNANTLKWNNDGTDDYTITLGNNVYVQEDHDGYDSTFGYSPKSSTNPPNLNFDFTPDFLREPTDTINMNFSLTNLFYWTNLMHDLSYQYGFDEVAGNFQQSNMSRGGQDEDLVIADAQDSSAFNNANFATPPDGSYPAMQMYFWDPSLIYHLYVNSPSSYKGNHYAMKDVVSAENSFLKTGPVTADVAFFIDSTGTHTGCTGAMNPNALKNRIAYIDRGSCNFTVKFLKAQAAGAKGIIVGNYSGDNTLISMGGSDSTIKIPGVFVTGSDGDSLRKYLNAAVPVNASLYGPQLDGELDNTISTHEYTHGISTRLVGGAQNVSCLKNKEQMGEGWSDWYAMMITQDWPKTSVSGDHIRTIGNYAFGLDGNFIGIRTYPYSTNMNINPWTYDSLAKLPTSAQLFDVHTVGEIWCTMLWDLTWKLIGSYGIGDNIFDATQTGGNNAALSLVTQGMKLTNCSPGFIDARNGILKADTVLYGGKYSKQIWEAFAARGLGFSAAQGNSNNTTDGVAAYDIPAVLPVTFSGFTAEKHGDAALLKWTTAQESNTNKFIVERSADGKPFVSIGEVKAAGNSSVKKSYQFTDASPIMGVNLYHIKEVDNDGKINLSDIRSLNFADISPSVTISPNPATNTVTIRIPGNNQNLTVRLLSNTGQLISTHAMPNESYTIDVSRLAAGVYNIVINGSDYAKKYKLVIQ
ncbi:MAG TPA: M36 family metallopeptidase [Parafilimonas sp.]|nr:M36 family metallopeptidase [Parafilimonas sp.]